MPPVGATSRWLGNHRIEKDSPYPGTVALTVSLSGPASLRVLIHLPMKCAVWFASLPSKFAV